VGHGVLDHRVDPGASVEVDVGVEPSKAAFVAGEQFGEARVVRAQ
jgi:hypothetical protein